MKLKKKGKYKEIFRKQELTTKKILHDHVRLLRRKNANIFNDCVLQPSQCCSVHCLFMFHFTQNSSSIVSVPCIE